VQRQSFPVSDARIITPATRPLGKSRPRTKLILAFGGLAGLMVGFGIALVRHNVDRSIRSSQQLREELGFECLGMIPRISARRRNGHFDEVARAPFSRFSNGLKSVKAAISLAGKARSIRCIGVTSALPKEGKSTVASNLATLFSMSGSRTLVIDADLYRSTLTKRFAPHSTVGLIEALQEPDPELIKQRVVQAGAASFDLLPAVPKPIVNSTEILGSHRMQALLQALYQSYDVVIFDLPPLGPVVDTMAISHHLDGIVVVIEWGGTSVDTVVEVSRSLRASKAPILGAALTKVDANAIDHYGKHDALYYR
jgi:capsular exopolysaccharide synthesis family protein